MRNNRNEHDNLPTMLNADDVAGVLGLSKTKVYELMNSREFPTLRIGKRMMVSKEQLVNWINKKSGEMIE
ncbi:MAG: helix-turn-helix domain-containing protein [Clostridia bacterium]|jgi:excisionase family DNA binding protein|nr:helix-turn-helix domain-containing protein [Clostridia bacterium]